jgi:ParB family chromosome partitioning protein
MHRHELRIIEIDTIFVGERLRELDAKRVADLAGSIEELGLQLPISVCDYDGEAEAYWQLIAGAHRLAAFKSLGRTKIEAFIVLEVDDIDREILEIVENLHRVDLSKDERDRHLRRYAELLEARQSRNAGKSSVQNGRNSKRGRMNEGRPPKIASEIAKQTGLSRQTVARAIGQVAPTPKVEPDREEPDMKMVAIRLAAKFTVGQLQELIDHLTDNIKARMAA